LEQPGLTGHFPRPAFNHLSNITWHKEAISPAGEIVFRAAIFNIPSLKLFVMKHYHIISRIAIYLLSVVLIIFGVFHFLHPRDLIVYVPTFLVGGLIWVKGVGVALILVGLSFLTNQFVKISSYLLVILLLVFILTIHLPNYMNSGDKDMRQLALINMLKDTAIMCFALHIAAGAHHQHIHFENSD
jgi:putative oxidoreductase